MRALCIAAALGIGCRSPAPGHPGTGQPGRGADADLTPEALGLPATPDGEAPASKQLSDETTPQPPPVSLADLFTPPPQARFYNHQECPPGRRGCVVSRTVTDELVSTKLSCPQGASYVGSRALRRLVATDFHVEAPDGASATLAIGDVRKPVVRHIDRFRACLGTTAASIDVQLAISPFGRVVSSNSNAADRQCVIDMVAAFSFPRVPSATLARFRLDYTVEDPNAYVKPLDCP